MTSHAPADSVTTDNATADSARAPAAWARIANGQALALSGIPVLSGGYFRHGLLQRVGQGARVAALFALPDGEPSTGGGLLLLAVLADDAAGMLSLAQTALDADAFPSLTPHCPQVHLFEREIAEQYGAVPEGHPWFKPVRFHGSYRPGHQAFGAEGAPPRIGDLDFYRVEGEEVHEVAVGPVHAGVIEPGHFRFQCHGERVFHLEISLGYQHRGVERAMIGEPTPRSIHTMETAAGDTTIGHASAYCAVLEALTGEHAPPRAQALRAVALELERLANHAGDLGALAGDVGYLPTASYCGRIRGDFLNLTAALCGSRFGRGMVRPGGSGFDLSAEEARDVLRRLDAAARDAKVAIELLWNTPSAMARFDGIGAVLPADAAALGMVGPAARACGLPRDVRHDHPGGAYGALPVPPSTWHSGDVFARAYLRWLEMQRSIAFIREQLHALPEGAVQKTVRNAERQAVRAPLAPEHAAVALVEGWRGEICHVALTDAAGRLRRYKAVDPSFHNWSGLALALRGQQISDFPLCNKSFNLSYCGHDL